jgi:uncharacterized protein with FMN-binding domain
MKKSIKIILIIIAVILVLGGAFAAKYFSDLSSYRQAVEEITIGEVDLATIPDGVYTGSAEAVWVGATVEVTVSNHQITAIFLDHRHGQGEDAEVIPDQVIETQSLQVDLISGVTSSSKVILKAIENALRSASAAE